MFSTLIHLGGRARPLALWLLFGSTAIASPAHASHPMSPVTVLFQSDYCGSDSASLEWITDPSRLEAIRANLAAPGARPPALPDIDPGSQPLLLLSMGSQATPGYRVSPGAPLPSIKGNTLRVPMHWSQPPAGLMLPQVITYPCLLFSVADGAYTRIELIDQKGQPRLSAIRP